MPRISVIVPVYKVEKYLNRCVDSILSQTFTDFELILVDDGSPDNCGNICDEYAKHDKRIVVIHKENGGLSSARNAGMRLASCEYMCFIDSDDYINGDYLQHICNAINEHSPDIIYYGLKYSGSNRMLLPKFKTNVVKTGKELIELRPTISTDKSIPFSVRYCFSVKYIRNNSFYYNEHIKYAEDSPFNLIALFFAEKVVCINEADYVYCCDNSDSITSKPKPTMVDDLDYYYSKQKYVGERLASQSQIDYSLDICKQHLFLWLPTSINNYKRIIGGLKVAHVKKILNSQFIIDSLSFYRKNDLYNRKLQKYYFTLMEKKRYLTIFILWRWFNLDFLYN